MTKLTKIAATVPSSAVVSDVARREGVEASTQELRGVKRVVDANSSLINDNNAAAKKQKQQPQVDVTPRRPSR